MRLMIIVAAAALACTSPALAKGNPQMKVCAAQWKTAPHAGTTYKAFMSSCLRTGVAGPAPATQAVPAPATTPAPAPAAAAQPITAKVAPAAGSPTAKCKDGTLSYSAHHSGSCSRHGGVASFM